MNNFPEEYHLLADSGLGLQIGLMKPFSDVRLKYIIFKKFFSGIEA